MSTSNISYELTLADYCNYSNSSRFAKDYQNLSTFPRKIRLTKLGLGALGWVKNTIPALEINVLIKESANFSCLELWALNEKGRG